MTRPSCTSDEGEHGLLPGILVATAIAPSSCWWVSLTIYTHNRTPLSMLSQTKTSDIAWPQGVGMRVKGGRKLLLFAHGLVQHDHGCSGYPEALSNPPYGSEAVGVCYKVDSTAHGFPLCVTAQHFADDQNHDTQLAAHALHTFTHKMSASLAVGNADRSAMGAASMRQL